MMFLGTHKIFRKFQCKYFPQFFIFYLLATFNQLRILNHVLWIKFYLLYIIYAERMSKIKKYILIDDNLL